METKAKTISDFKSISLSDDELLLVEGGVTHLSML